MAQLFQHFGPLKKFLRQRDRDFLLCLSQLIQNANLITLFLFSLSLTSLSLDFWPISLALAIVRLISLSRHSSTPPIPLLFRFHPLGYVLYNDAAPISIGHTVDLISTGGSYPPVWIWGEASTSISLLRVRLNPWSRCPNYASPLGWSWALSSTPSSSRWCSVFRLNETLVVVAVRVEQDHSLRRWPIALSGLCFLPFSPCSSRLRLGEVSSPLPLEWDLVRSSLIHRGEWSFIFHLHLSLDFSEESVVGADDALVGSIPHLPWRSVVCVLHPKNSAIPPPMWWAIMHHQRVGCLSLDEFYLFQVS